MINMAKARRINRQGMLLAYQWEEKVLALFISLRKKNKEWGALDDALLLAYLIQELDTIKAAMVQVLDECLPAIYNQTMVRTVMESPGRITVMKAKGYSKQWCRDGKTYEERVAANINKIQEDIMALVVSIDDPTVLYGLLMDKIQQAENEWRRLLRTEAEAAYSQGARDAYLMKGCRYAVIENDSPCDEICAEEVGEHEVNLNGALGIDLPPYHPNCQCVFLGIFGREDIN